MGGKGQTSEGDGDPGGWEGRKGEVEGTDEGEGKGHRRRGVSRGIVGQGCCVIRAILPVMHYTSCLALNEGAHRRRYGTAWNGRGW